jgi:hypothetical protein
MDCRRRQHQRKQQPGDAEVRLRMAEPIFFLFPFHSFAESENKMAAPPRALIMPRLA